MDDLDRQLLLFLQNGIPLQKRPFEGVAARLGLDSADVLLRISRLKLKKIIRQITVVLEGRNLGYECSLAAMMVPRAKLEGALFWMNAHPGVTSCSMREDEFNVWFTLVLPAGTTEKQLRRLHTFAGAKKTILLPALKRFKGEAGMAFPGGNESAGVSLSAAELALLRRIQEEFPLDDEPFRKLADDAGIPEPEVLGILDQWMRKGYFKKITSVMPSKSAVVENEILVVWEVPEERQDETGRRMAAFEEITDCVKRTAYPEFPYALYATVKAAGPEEVESIFRKISNAVGSWPHRALGSGKECKKIRLKYFSEGLEDWQYASSPNGMTQEST